MLKAINIRLWGIVCVLLGACNGFVAAQNVVFTANASADKIGLKDRLQVTYTIQNVPNLQSIDRISSDDFEIVGGPFSSQSTSVSIAGNRTVQSVRVSLTYILQPKHTGSLTVPSSSAKDAAGHTYQSNSIPIQVVNGTLAAAQPARQQANPYDPFNDDPFADPFAAIMQRRQQQLQQMRRQMQNQAQQQDQNQPMAKAPADINKDLFIRVSVDKSKVHVGEQVTASYKLYSRIPMQVGISKLPSLNGFWTQDFDIPKDPKPMEEVVDGKKYQVFLLKKSALFPQQPGTLELDPAEAQGVARIIQQVRQRNPFADMFDDPYFQNAMGGSLMMNDPFFNNGFFNSIAYKDVQVHLKSTPVKIQVTALPDKGKPENYGGAVGKFAINSKIDKTELSTDETANLSLTITGSGNLKLMAAPQLNLPNGLESYDPQIVDTITGRSTTISGSKIITYPIAPRTPGDYDIPATPFTYYDPQSGEYVTLQTQPISLHVKPGKNYNPAVAKNNKPLTDIHNIETGTLDKLAFNSKPLLFSPGYWSMYALPLLAFVGIVFWKRRDEELSKDMVKLRNRRANKVALKRLATAQKLLKDNQRGPFYEEISKAIWLYLSDKLNIPLSSLSHETATAALEERKVPANLQQKMGQVVNECETALYTPSGGSQQMHSTYETAIKVISELEETINA
ncbi:MAG: hypothetical protein BGO69_04895 [Bacteroidetes bacterium 46-16]|nr:MAG: hypothetical protein BGO69_04895 [Bacteroidetes bacterium 46-16]